MSNISDELLKLDNQICFPLYVASKEVVKRYKPYLDKLDITYTQYIVLLCLWEKDHVLVKDLGSRLYLDSGTLTPLLNKLENKGYINKIRGEKDGRETYICLTDLGHSLKNEAYCIPTKMSKCLNIDEKEIYTLYQLLHKILEGFKDESREEDYSD